MLMYYPEDKEISLTYYYNYDDKMSISSSVVLCADGEVYYCLSMPGQSVYGMKELAPKNFGNGSGSLRFDEYSGASQYRAQLESAAETYAVVTLLMFDRWMDELFPGMSISDFGFVNLNYEAYGFNVN